MASLVIHDTLISGYLAVRGLSIINKQLKVVTVIKVMFSNNLYTIYNGDWMFAIRNGNDYGLS